MTEFSDDSQFSTFAALPVNSAVRKANWTPEQLVRIDYEWRRLQRNFAYHPVVRVIPVEGEPPTQYEFEYRVRTLGYNDAGQLDYLTSCTVTVELPSAFPHAAPVVRPTKPLFHPNISEEAQQVAIVPGWTPGTTLEDVLMRVGVLLAFQAYDPYTVWNPVAMQWVAENSAYLPTDPSVSIAPENGGDPADRIRRSGATTLRQLREQLVAICGSMLDVGDPPTGADVRQFARGVRMATSLFQASDLPEELSKPAGELQEWATQLPLVAPTFEALRATKANTSTAMGVLDELNVAAANLAAQLSALEKMVTTTPAVDPFETMRQIPPSADLKTALAVLRGLLSAAEQRLDVLKQWIPSLVEASLGQPLAPSLQNVVNAEAARQRSALAEAREKLRSGAAKAAVVIDRTRNEVAALEQLERWKLFSELTEKGHALVMRLETWGAAGVQAYFVTMADQQYGPFDFELQIELGSAPLAIRNMAQRTMELLDAPSGRRLATSENGQIKFDVPGENEGEAYPAIFQLTTRCDDLWLQLEYIVRQTQTLLTPKLATPVETPSWSGRYSTSLATAAAGVDREHRAAVAHLLALVAELKAVGAFKERIATYHLLKRLSEQAPQYVQQRTAAAEAVKQATHRIAEIQARSAHDATTGQIIIPARLHKEYSEKLEQRDRGEAKIEMTDKILRHLANQVRARTASRSIFGSAAWPDLTVLSPLPDELYQLSTEMTDEQLAAMIADMGAVMRVDLKAPEAPAARVRSAAAPATQPAAHAAPASPQAHNPVPQPRPLAPVRQPQVPPPHQQAPYEIEPEQAQPAGPEPVHHAAAHAAHEDAAITPEEATHEGADHHEAAAHEQPAPAAGAWDFVDDHAEGEHHEEQASDDIFGDWPTDHKAAD